MIIHLYGGFGQQTPPPPTTTTTTTTTPLKESLSAMPLEIILRAS